jgi:histidinol dehydrogenase
MLSPGIAFLTSLHSAESLLGIVPECLRCVTSSTTYRPLFSQMKVFRPTDANYAAALSKLNRRAEASEHVREVVASVIAKVRADGDAALLELTAKFDGAHLSAAQLRVTDAELAAAEAQVDADTRAALEAAKRNVQAFAKASLRQPWSMKNEQGAEVGEVFHPFQRVGCYVPGGTAPLVSTSIMTVAIAAAAGVPEIVVCTPCGKDGQINPGLLTALKLAGATEIYRIGGSQAIAAMAYGTATIAPVVKIVGPGNSYVVEAKRQAFGAVSIDLLPGPSEVLILSDKTGNAAFIAADFLAQAEHGKDSGAGFITDDAALLEAVLAEIQSQATRLGRQAMVQTVLEKDGFAVLVADLNEGVKLVNGYAPEHLVLVAQNETELLPQIRTAGAVFCGNYSPVAVGDFLAGPSHTLPTGGSGKSFPGITADMFQRRTSIVRLDRESCAKSEPIVRAFSQVEGLDAHGESVAIRARS